MSFIIFFKKELYEFFRTAKGIALAAIFLITAISSPLLAKLTPELLKWAMGTASEFDSSMDAFDLSMLAEPTSIDSYAQFFSNINFLGLLAIIIVFAGIVAGEKHKGTAAYILTKNISRVEFILSKFAASCVFTLSCMTVSLVILKVYTDMLFGDKLIDIKYLLLYFALFYLYIIFILAITVFSSVIAKNVTGATVMSFLIFMCINIVASIPRLGKFMPPNINQLGVMLNTIKIDDIIPNIIITAVVCVFLVFAGVEIFNRQEL